MTIGKTTYGNFIQFDSPLSCAEMQVQDYSEDEAHYMDQALRDWFINDEQFI